MVPPSRSDPALPLSALLSGALVAFTVEFDNEAEHRMAHATTRHGRQGHGGPWLASYVMWANALRLLDDDGLTVAELERRAGTATNLPGLRRWGYVVFDPEPTGSSKPPRRDAVVRPTSRGRRAQAVWAPLAAEVEARWAGRLGERALGGLRRALEAVVARLGPLPDGLPIVGYGLVTVRRGDAVDAAGDPPTGAVGRSGAAGLALPALLSRALVSLARAYEREARLSLAVAANVVRLLAEPAVVADLPERTGVARESVDVAVGFLERRGLATVGTTPSSGRRRMVRLTPRGQQARAAFERRLPEVEARWRQGVGGPAVDRLRRSLEAVVGDPATDRTPLAPGLEPYPDGWRATVRRPATLPRFPVVTHRGGYPDGS